MFRQGAPRPKFVGYVFALMLLASTAFGNPQLDVSNSTNFFAKIASAMFQQMNLRDFNGNLVTVTNIPIYEDTALVGVTNINYYTPAVHRVLQLAANLFDATTNRFIGGGPTNYPTVFRPVFSSDNGVVYISGYMEVTDPAVAFLPMLERTNFVKTTQFNNTNANIYGVPWVIGAKKGFPNFNEFSMDNPVSVSRKLTFTNAIGQPPWITNQIYDISVTNSFGFELWNSYTNAYSRPLSVTVSNEVSIQVYDQNGLLLLDVVNLPFGTNVTYDFWEGWNRQQADPLSFKLPLGIVTANFVNGIYKKDAPQFIPLNPATFGSLFVPHLWMTLQFKVRCAVIDTAADRIVDFVNIDSTQPPVDLSELLNDGATGVVPNDGEPRGQWDTNLWHGVQVGILNQIDVSMGGQTGGFSVWHDPNTITKQKQINDFVKHLLNGGTNYFQAPYTPQGTIFQRISWQANDPLVHYTETDLTSTNGPQLEYNAVSLASIFALGNLGRLNYIYQPWGGDHLPPYGSSLNPSISDYDLRVKDPGVQQSDEWNFPTGESLSFDWLGRVHRGTPWQTVFLKPSNQTVVDWVRWGNDNVLFTNGNSTITFDAAFSHPANDRYIASLWARWLNTNDISTLLSINNTDTNAWAARLDGLTVFTNSAAGLDTITIMSNSPQAGIIAQAIQTARANSDPATGVVFPNFLFRQVGDVLATRELSVSSPFLNTNGMTSGITGFFANGITDEAMEKIPTQLIPLLRAGSFGQIVPAGGEMKLFFSGYDGHNYVIQVSSNLIDWVSISTNYPTDGSFGMTNNVNPGPLFYRSVLLH